MKDVLRGKRRAGEGVVTVTPFFLLYHHQEAVKELRPMFTLSGFSRPCVSTQVARAFNASCLPFVNTWEAVCLNAIIILIPIALCVP
jgi:hypothetical protein